MSASPYSCGSLAKLCDFVRWKVGNFLLARMGADLELTKVANFFENRQKEAGNCAGKLATFYLQKRA